MGGNVGGNRGTRQRTIKGRKKWDNCNSIINKIYLQKKLFHLWLVCLSRLNAGLGKVADLIPGQAGYLPGFWASSPVGVV